MGIDHFSVRGTKTLVEDDPQEGAIKKFREAISKMVGAANPPPPSRFSDCPDVDPADVQACIETNESLYLGALRQAAKIVVVEDSTSLQGENIMEDPKFCLWDAKRDRDPEYSTSENPTWLAAKKAFEAIPNSCQSSLRKNSLEDPFDEVPPLFSTTHPDELLRGLNLSLLGSAQNILELYQCGSTINTPHNVSGRWPMLEYNENNKKPTVSENEDSENEDKECVEIWGKSNTQGPVMIRKDLEVSLEYRDSCYAAKQGYCAYTHYTLDQDGNQLVPCDSFAERNKKRAIFHFFMKASIYFYADAKPPLACFNVWTQSTYEGFRYRGPKTSEIKRLENCDDPEQLKPASPAFSRHFGEQNRRSPLRASEIVTQSPSVQQENQTSNVENNLPSGQVPTPLSIAKQLGSDPEQWAKWLAKNPFSEAVNNALDIHFLLLAMYPLLKNTTGENTLEEIKLHGWPIEAFIATVSVRLALYFVSDLNRKPGRIERGWMALMEGIKAGLYGAVVADESVRLIKHSDWTLSRREFLHYMLPAQVWFACMIAVWTFMKSAPSNRWRESHPETASFLDGVAGTVSNGALLGTGLLALLYTHPIVQLSTMIFMSTLFSCLERSSQGLMRCAKTIFDYAGATLLTIALIFELHATFNLPSSEKKSTSVDDIVYARAALWFLLCVGSTTYMIYLARRAPSKNQYHTSESPITVVSDNPSPRGQPRSIEEGNALGSPRSIESDDATAATERSSLLIFNRQPGYETDSAPSPDGGRRKSVSFGPELHTGKSQIDQPPVINGSSSEQGSSESPQSDRGSLAGCLKLAHSHSPHSPSPLRFSTTHPSKGPVVPCLRLAEQDTATPLDSGTEGDSEHEPPDSPEASWAFHSRGEGHSSRPRRGRM